MSAILAVILDFSKKNHFLAKLQQSFFNLIENMCLLLSNKHNCHYWPAVYAFIIFHSHKRTGSIKYAVLISRYYGRQENHIIVLKQSCTYATL